MRWIVNVRTMHIFRRFTAACQASTVNRQLTVVIASCIIIVAHVSCEMIIEHACSMMIVHVPMMSLREHMYFAQVILQIIISGGRGSYSNKNAEPP